MDEHSLIRAHSRALQKAAASNAAPMAGLAGGIPPLPSSSSMVHFPQAVFTSETGNYIVPSSTSSASAAPSTVEKKKKKKKRVVQDIEVIGAEYEEKERIMAERKARLLNMEEQVDDEPEPVVSTPQPTLPPRTAVSAASATAEHKDVAPQEVEAPKPVEKVASVIEPAAPTVAAVSALPGADIDAAPSAAYPPSTEVPHSPERISVRSRYSLTPQQQVKGPPANMQDSDVAIEKLSLTEVPEVPAVQPRSIFSAENVLKDEPSSQLSEPELKQPEAAPAPVEERTESVAVVERSQQQQPVVEPIPAAAIHQENSKVARVEESKSVDVSTPTVISAPAQPAAASAVMPVDINIIASTSFNASNSAVSFAVEPSPFASPPRARDATASQNPTLLVSPAVNANDMKALSESALHETDNAESMAATMIKDKKFPPGTNAASAGPVSNLAKAMEAAAANDPKLQKRAAAAVAAAAAPQPAASLHTSSHTLAVPSSSSSSSQPITKKKSNKVVLESTDEYDVILNQIASSPAATISPQLRALARMNDPRASPLTLASSSSAGSGSQFILSPSSSAASLRPQLASLGLAYVSDYFDESKTGSGIADTSLPATPMMGATNGNGAVSTPPMNVPRSTRVLKTTEAPADGEEDDESYDEFPSGSPQEEGQHIKTLIRPVTRETPKILMKKQGSKCAGCSQSIFLTLWSKPRYCHYTGALYCPNCHQKETRVIPGQVLVNGDTRKYKVCNLASAYLDTMYSIPSIPMAAISPHLYQTCKDLGLVFVLRQQLAHIRAFIMTCKKKDALLKLLGQRQYMLNDTIIRSSGDKTPPRTPAVPTVTMMAQSVTSDAMPTVEIGSYMPQKSLLSQPTPLSAAIAQSRDELSSSPPAIESSFPSSNQSHAPVQAVASPARGSSRARPTAGASSRFAESASSSSSSSASVHPSFDGFDPLVDDPILNPTLRDMYSLRDLVEILQGSLYNRLTTVVRQLQAHIVGGRCEICTNKAFFCEVSDCPEPSKPIYSFQLSSVVQCPQCSQCFHRACFEPTSCPKCARLAQRKLVQQQKLAQAKAGVVQRMNSGNYSLSSSPINPSGINIPPPMSGRNLGFAPTGMSGSLRSERSEVAGAIERTRGGSRGSSPVRKINERLAAQRSQSPAPK